jgi:hypothetical protein
VIKVVKRAVMFTVILLACAGVYSAVTNLPVLSGCTFYGECPNDAATDELPAIAAKDASVDGGVSP